jgi:hypothetical protein
MLGRSVNLYVGLGLTFRYLRSAEAEWSFHGKNLIKENVDRLLTLLEQCKYVLTLRGANHLHELQEELQKKPQDEKLTK